MDNQSNKRAAQAFAAAFAASLTQSLTDTAKQPLKFEVMESPSLDARPGEPVHYRLSVGGALSGECYVEFYEPQVAELGARIMDKPATDYSDADADALATEITAAIPGITAALASEYGELTLKVDRVKDLAFGGMLLVPLAGSLDGEPTTPVLLYFDGKFLTALASQTATGSSASAARSSIDPANLKLVMDVELNVLLRFGQREMPLRDVLDLASGSIIELDRQVDDPVELLLDGKVIARGEAVIVDGNYGLRVTEIPQPIASHF
jgi:flagellar motor switch protein FliN/FliY